MKRLIFIFSLCLMITAGTGLAQTVLKLATTTSTYETGLLDYLFEPFEKEQGITVHVISVGTGKALTLARNGDVDIVLVHARKLEDEFISQGWGVNRRDVMYNDFVIAGPEHDPAGIRGIKDPVEAFSILSRTGTVFVSRGDNSGTHVRERSYWKKAGVTPQHGTKLTYLESGQGQSATLRIASEKQGYCLVDRGTFLFQKDNIDLHILCEGGRGLVNPYGVIAVSPYRFHGARYKEAMALIWWLTSPRCQNMIAEFKVRGSALFFPNAEQAQQ